MTHGRKSNRLFLCTLTIISFVQMSIWACTTKRTPEETKALLIGIWETVTDNEFEIREVITDSTIQGEEFGISGRYTVFSQDSITIYGVDTTIAKVSFPEGETTLMFTTKDWYLRMRKVLEPEQ